MWNYPKLLKLLEYFLYGVVVLVGIIVLAFFARPADADEYEPPHHQSNVWQSGTIDGRLGLDPSGQDMNDAYMLDYMDAREEARHGELMEAIEESRDE